MKARTAKNRKFQFNEKARHEICARDDETCIFCRRGYHMENKDTLLYRKKDIMHYINKSQGGLGLPENGAVGCRYHHMLLDNEPGAARGNAGNLPGPSQRVLPGMGRRKSEIHKMEFPNHWLIYHGNL